MDASMREIYTISLNWFAEREMTSYVTGLRFLLDQADRTRDEAWDAVADRYRAEADLFMQRVWLYLLRIVAREWVNT